MKRARKSRSEYRSTEGYPLTTSKKKEEEQGKKKKTTRALLHEAVGRVVNSQAVFCLPFSKRNVPQLLSERMRIHVNGRGA